MNLPKSIPAEQSATDTADRETVFLFEKNSRESVIASLSRFKGETYLDLRVFVETDGGRHVPTRKGLTLRPVYLQDLERAVQALREAAVREGLVG